MNENPINENQSLDNTPPQVQEREQGQFETCGSASLQGITIKHENEQFIADRKDGIVALFAFVLGFLFIRWVLIWWQGWGVTVFTFCYCAVVSLYFYKKGVHITRAGWFWLTVTVLVGISYALWQNNGIGPLRAMFLFCCAVYFAVCASGVLIQGKTSNWMMLDGVNTVFVIPFRNFDCQYKSIAALKGKNQTAHKRVWSIALGLLLALIVAVIVLPLLLKADSGGFSMIMNGVLKYFQSIQNEVNTIIFQCILTLPVAGYMFGLMAGCANKRKCDTFEREKTKQTISAMRILPEATVYTMLGFVCLLYAVFIASQLPYFFSAFVGTRPDGWQVYSEYARSGFFELCRIAAINLSLIAGANLLCKKARKDSLALKVFNCVLVLLTLILIATALSKMALYIGVYGLSVQRLLPCAFMVFLAVVCCGVIALQKWDFSIMRFAAIVGTVMFCTMCLMDTDGFVVRYNADRYLAGTLSGFDVDILYRSGPAGVDCALDVYSHTGDEVLKSQLREYFIAQQIQTTQFYMHPQDNLQNANARQKTAGYAGLSLSN